MKSKILLVTSVIAIILSMACFGNSVYAKKSPYDSGYSHGENDCYDIKDGVSQSQVYYFKPKYGPDMHTQTFNDGFRDGWSNAGCSNQELNDRLYPEIYTDNSPNYNTAIDDSNFDDHSNQQSTTQLANTNQIGQCPQMLLNGNCILGQSQDIDNDFAAANRNN